MTDLFVEIRRGPNGLAFRRAEPVRHVDMAEEKDRVVMQGSHAVVESIWGPSDRFRIDGGGWFGEARELSEDFGIGFAFELGPFRVVVGGLVDWMRQTESGDLFSGEEGGGTGRPSGSAKKYIGGHFGSIVQSDQVGV